MSLLINSTATISNSDIIPFRKRGMYQALQNSMFGFGAICGASFGGAIADSTGWYARLMSIESMFANISRRCCFLLQVPISAVALFLGWLVISNPTTRHFTWQEIKARVDFTGALLLVVAVSIQLAGLSLGGNELPWSSGWVIGCLLGSIVLLATFVLVEAITQQSLSSLYTNCGAEPYRNPGC